jgi:hypothetical protein
MQPGPEKVQLIVMACCILHNLMRIRYPRQQNQQVDREDPETHEILPGAWREDNALIGLQPAPGNTGNKAGKAIRHYLRQYYNSAVGSVPWQDRMI